jgi:hypothetical protein
VLEQRQWLPLGDARALVKYRRNQIPPEFEAVDIYQRRRRATESDE